MIRDFKDEETEKLFYRQYSRFLPHDIQPVAIRKLWMLNAARDINDLRMPPANHLERLRGERKGQYSIRINNRWRICFDWRENNAFDVEITDYH